MCMHVRRRKCVGGGKKTSSLKRDREYSSASNNNSLHAFHPHSREKGNEDLIFLTSWTLSSHSHFCAITSADGPPPQCALGLQSTALCHGLNETAVGQRRHFGGHDVNFNWGKGGIRTEEDSDPVPCSDNTPGFRQPLSHRSNCALAASMPPHPLSDSLGPAPDFTHCLFAALRHQGEGEIGLLFERFGLGYISKMLFCGEGFETGLHCVVLAVLELTL